MSTIGSGYDLSATTFSPEGRVFQVEYATKAVDNAGTCIGLKVKNGVVLAAQNLIHSKLLVPGTTRRIANADMHTGMASAGFIADGRQLVNRAREEAKNYRNLFNHPVPAKILTDRLGLYIQAHTLYSSVRPFGSTVLIASVDADGPQLYSIEPSGQCWGYFGYAIGKGKQSARTEIEKLNLKDMDILEAVREAARIIYTVHNETKDKQFELEMTWISSHSNDRHEHVPQHLLIEASNYAKAFLESSMAD